MVMHREWFCELVPKFDIQTHSLQTININFDYLTESVFEHGTYVSS
jgi:hypothetical protein